jgi:poly(hydroxyalkanoate) depolymerase family esterase
MPFTVPDWMARATELTRAGRLGEATALIQSALQSGGQQAPGPQPPADDASVVDVEARVVDVHASDASVEATDSAVPPASSAPPSTAASQWLSGHHAESAGARSYRLYVPAGTPAGPRPLLVMLHGCTQDPDDFARGTRMNALADAHGFLVLYPAQAHRAHAQGCWNWFKHNHQQRGRGEPAVLAGMVRAVMAQHAVDPQRVFVAGLSAGGAMAAILGRAYPELFAAVGVHSGLPPGAAQDLPSALSAMQTGAAAATVPPGGPPSIVFHGDQDTVVHPANATGVLQACAGSAAGGQAQPGQAGGRSYTRQVWVDATGAVRAELWLVRGAGHAWSGGSAQGSHTDPAGPDASREMLRFFLEHPLPAGGGTR